MKKPPPRQRDIHGASREAMSPLKVAGMRGIIWRESRKVAAPPLQDKMGGNPKVAHFFNECFWTATTISNEKPVMPSYSQSVWQKVAYGWYQEMRAKIPRRQDQPRRHTDKRAFNNPFAKLKEKLK